jgi:hypothetical protein
MSAAVVTGGAARTRLHLGTTAHNDITAHTPRTISQRVQRTGLVKGQDDVGDASLVPASSLRGAPPAISS